MTYSDHMTEMRARSVERFAYRDADGKTTERLDLGKLLEFLTHDCIGPDDVETDEYLLLPYAVSCTQMIEIVILALAGFKTPQQPEPLPARNQGRERLLQLRTLQVLDTTPPCPRFWGRRRWQTRLAKRLAEVYSE